jgi:hypothetical protein
MRFFVAFVHVAVDLGDNAAGIVRAADGLPGFEGERLPTRIELPPKSWTRRITTPSEKRKNRRRSRRISELKPMRRRFNN